MKLIIVSKNDKASCNIFQHLLKMREWTKNGEFNGNPLYYHEDLCIAVINDEHIFHDDLDKELRDVLNAEIETMIYASRHRSQSGKRTLTVHPIGNYNKAEFGGRPKCLVPSSPHLMTEALRVLTQKKKDDDLDYAVSFEATHHGPHLNTPTFFIEIGSDEKAWVDEAAGKAIAETILEAKPNAHPVGIGIGGGHYSPRITDVALERKISFGHIIPTYALPTMSPQMMDKVIEATPQVELAYFHRKGMKSQEYRHYKNEIIDRGIKPVRSADLEQV